MTPDKYSRLKQLFEQALDTPLDRRNAFVDKIRQRDEEEGRALGELLKVHGDSGGDGTRSIITPLFRFDRFLSTEAPAFAENELLLGRFRIVRFIGRGGMGEVYEAEDLQLGRVALKTIRASLAGTPTMIARFRQEVQLARRITSPNVCRIHELFQLSDHLRGTAAFLTMEFLQGFTLFEQIRRYGHLELAEVQTIARQLCAGVQAIHDAGVIHRDIKSSNVMLAQRNGVTQAVVMDLGLARESDSAQEAPTDLTVPGAVMGTTQYAAPEQLAGAAVTPAADVYALGVMLYEIVTGRLPFPATTVAAAVLERVKRPPTPSSLRANVPKSWDEAIFRCLEHEREKRWSSAQDLAGVFARVERRRSFRFPASRPDRRPFLRAFAAIVLTVLASAAVWLLQWEFEGLLNPLPTERHVALMEWPKMINSSTDSRALLNSILNAIDNRLAREESSSKRLMLISSADLINQIPLGRPSDAVNALGANLVLAASLRSDKAGASLDLQLLDAVSGKVLRHRKLLSAVKEFKFLPERAGIAAAKLIEVRSNHEETRERNEMADLPPKAFELFSSAKDLLDQPNDVGLDPAIESYQKSLELAPTFSAGYAALSMAFIRKYWKFRNESDLNAAATNSAKAIRYRPDSAQSVLSGAMVKLYSGRTEEAIDLFGKALQLDPGNPEIPFYKAHAFHDLGQAREEESTYREIIHERPNFWPAYNQLGNCLMRQGHSRYDEAAKEFSNGAAIAPRVALLLTNLGTVYMLDGKKDEAQETFRKSLALAPNENAYINLGDLAFEGGHYQSALDYYARARDLKPKNHLIWRNIADCFTMLGQPALMTANYQKAEEALSEILRTNPRRGSDWMTLAFYESKLGRRREAEQAMKEGEDRGASDIESLFTKAQALAVLGQREASRQLVMECLRKGLSPVEVNLAVDFRDLRSDPTFRRYLTLPAQTH